MEKCHWKCVFAIRDDQCPRFQDRVSHDDCTRWQDLAIVVREKDICEGEMEEKRVPKLAGSHGVPADLEVHARAPSITHLYLRRTFEFYFLRQRFLV